MNVSEEEKRGGRREKKGHKKLKHYLAFSPWISLQTSPASFPLIFNCGNYELFKLHPLWKVCPENFDRVKLTKESIISNEFRRRSYQSFSILFPSVLFPSSGALVLRFIRHLLLRTSPSTVDRKFASFQNNLVSISVKRKELRSERRGFLYTTKGGFFAVAFRRSRSCNWVTFTTLTNPTFSEWMSWQRISTLFFSFSLVRL